MQVFHKSLIKTLALSLASFSFSAGRFASDMPSEFGDSISPLSRDVEQLVWKQQTNPEEIAAYLNRNSRLLSNVLVDSI